jgi:hypothetical protein
VILLSETVASIALSDPVSFAFDATSIAASMIVAVSGAVPVCAVVKTRPFREL